ncbi:MAG: efflux RND transporter periplasmic adaptor subunit [Pseudomonadota bacterium]
MKKYHALVAAVGIAVLSAGAYWYQREPTRPASEGRSDATAHGPASAPRTAGTGAPAGGAGARGPVAVEMAPVQTTTLSEAAQAVGSLRSRQGVVLRPEVSGRVIALGFRDGQPVRKGQVIVQLDDTLAAAQVRQAQAQLSIARANHERNRELLAQNFVSQAAVDQTAATLQVAEAQLAVARATQERLRIVAPFDGVAGIRQVNVGDYVGPGTDLVNLEDVSSLYVDFRLPERYLPQLQVGQRSQVSLDALPGRRFEARIEALSPQVDAQGRSVLIRAVLNNREGALRPGMFARVDTLLASKTDALVVPEEALVPQGGKQYVIKAVKAEGAEGASWTSQRREVSIGLRRAGQVEILQGVDRGDMVVVAGHQRIQRDGTPLRPVQIGERGSSAASAPPAAGGTRDAQRGAAAPAMSGTKVAARH